MRSDPGSGDGLARDAGTASASGTVTVDGGPLPVSAILALCDRLVGEAGRRSHMFGWLRVPGGDAEQWLTVDAYYPSNRLVVVCRSEPQPHDGLYRDRIPAHGLRLLELNPLALGGPDTVEASLQRLIAELGPAPPKAREAPGAAARPLAVERPVTQAMSSLAPPAPPEPVERRVGQSHAAAAERGARFVATHPGARPTSGERASTADAANRAARRLATLPARPVPRARPAIDDVGQIETLGVVLGLAIVIVGVAEVFLGVAKFGLGDGHVLLAFGLALDACARTLGAVAAARAGRQEWAWWCALGGSPIVASFALFQRSGPVAVDPAPLAGLISLIAIVVATIGIAAAVTGAG
jgi:hypothetical protein